MTEEITTPPPTEAEAPQETYSFFQMFFVPMLIAGVLTGVIVFFGLIGRDEKTVAQYLQEIRFGGQHQRWQAAFELAYHLQEKGEAAAVTPQDRAAALDAFRESAQDPDPRIREYLALTLGQMRCHEAVGALSEALTDPSEKTRVYAVMSLGAIGDPQVEPALVTLLKHDDAGTRKAAAFALGSMPGAAARDGLAGALHDPVADVTWNAALSLCRLGDGRGKDTLLVMLDRPRIAATEGILPAQVNDVLEGAAKAAGAIGLKEAVPQLQALAKTDPDHKVREAAHASLGLLGAAP